MNTNKIDLIKAEVERIQLYTQSEVLKQVLDYIDSLQEEPKFKTGDRIKPIDSCLGSPRTIVDVRDSWYVTDQGTLDFEYEGNWELAEEHKKCMYSKDNYTNEDRKVLCEGCEEECKYAQKEESVSERFAFKAIPRLLEMIEPTDRAKVYVTKLADALEVEGYSTDAKIVMESLKIMNGEKVPMATMDEEPVSKDLEEASKEWLRPQLDKSYANYGETKMMELTHFDGYAMLDAIEFGAKWGRNQAMAEIQAQSMALPHGCPKESVCEDLGGYINELSKQFPEVSFAKLSRIAVRMAKWQKQQMMKDAIEAEIINWASMFTSIKVIEPERAETMIKEKFDIGDKVKLIIVKED